MTWPCRARATPSSTSGRSVMQTGQPGPMMTFKSLGKVARRPNFAIACSWLPQTCMTETGERPISAVTRAIVSARRRASAGSRNFSWRIAAVSRVSLAASKDTLSIAAPRPFDLAPHVGGHQVVSGRLRKQRLIEGQRLADVLLWDAPDRETDVIQDVVARRDGLVHDVQADLAAHSPEVHEGEPFPDRDDSPGNSEAHQKPPDLASAPATAAWPRARPPSPGGTRR